MPGVARLTWPTTGELHDRQRTASKLEDLGRLRSDLLHRLQARMDTHRRERSADGLSARSAAGPFGHDELRSLRTQQGANLTSNQGDRDPGGEFAAELGAVSATFAARMAAVRRSARPADIAALLRALQAQQVVAKRDVLNRWHMAARNASVQQSIAERGHPVVIFRKSLWLKP